MARRPSRGAAALVGVGIVVACAAAWAGSRGVGEAPATEPASAAEPAGVPSAAPPTSAAPTTAAPTTAADRTVAPGGPAGWQRLIGALYRRRASAFTTGSAGSLAGVYTAGSPQLAADQEALGRLVAARRTVTGFAPRVVRVRRVAVTGDRATVVLVDSWPAYAVIGRDGRAVATVPARAPTEVRMVLARTAAGWRLDHADRVG